MNTQTNTRENLDEVWICVGSKFKEVYEFIINTTSRISNWCFVLCPTPSHKDILSVLHYGIRKMNTFKQVAYFLLFFKMKTLKFINSKTIQHSEDAKYSYIAWIYSPQRDMTHYNLLIIIALGGTRDSWLLKLCHDLSQSSVFTCLWLSERVFFWAETSIIGLSTMELLLTHPSSLPIPLPSICSAFLC